MVVFIIDKEKYYSAKELEHLGFVNSKFPYANFKVYVKNHMYYLFKETKADKLIFDSINF